MMKIDSFVVELGLDPKKFTDGQKQALASLRQLEQQTAKMGGRIEDSSKNFDNFFSGIKRGALGALAGFFGGAGAVAIVNNISKADAAVGRLSYTMNQSVRDLSAWQGAAKQLGGSGEGVTASLAGMSQEMNTFLLTGQASFLPLLNRLDVGLFKQNGQLKEATELYLEVADAVKKAYPDDPARRAAMLQLLPGMNPETINLLIDGRKAMDGYLTSARQAGTTTEESAKAAQEYQRSLGLLGTAAENVSRTIVTSLTPSLVSGMNKLREFIQNPFGGGKTTGEFVTDTTVTGSIRKDSVADVFIQMLQRAKKGDGDKSYSQLWEEMKKGWSSAPETPTVSPPATGIPKLGLTKADRNNNPGNIEYGAFAQKHGATGSDGRFAIFPDRESGFKAAEALLASRGYRDLTLPQIGARWAEGDRNWAVNASKATGIPMDRPLTDEDRAKLARTGIPAAEGTRLPGAGAGVGSGGPSTTTQTTNVGTIVIHTAAKDADGIARDIEPALRRGALAAPANQGQF